MKYEQLGRSGLQASRLVLGTMNFGTHADERDSFEIMDRAIEAGFNFFDTADVYGGAAHPGLTEEIVGRWLQKSGHRDRVILATKVFGRMSPDINDRGLSAFHIRRAVEASLRRLGTDHIDLYQMHHIDRSATFEEIWQAFDTLIGQGKITYIGSSNFAGWHIASAAEAARERHMLGPISEQSHYNLLTRAVESEVLPAAQHYGVGVIAWSPLAGGALAGGDGVRRREATGESEPLAHALRQWFEFCRALGREPGHVALAWLLQRPGVHGPIIGPRTPAQLDSAVRALEIEFSEAELARLDDIFPGPGGPAPESYAW
ncbi:aldo/keto reductase [Microbacterium maritypicum]|uniref:aldo/keto reductase n=1 Tax=Microbacterium maritypicum TaxID=33918 RepID=UPI0037FD253F